MNKLKELINKLVDVKKLIVTVWMILWVVLIILTAFKFCFNVWYPVVCNNQKFISVCNFIDNHDWLKYILVFAMYIVSLNIWILISLAKFKHYKKWHLLTFNIFIIVSNIIKMFSNTAGCLFEIIYLVIFTAMINIKYERFKMKWVNYILPAFVYILINIWQSNMVFIKGIEDIITNLPTFVVIILQLDYYIFLINTWIGVSYIMGLASGGWWWSRQITRLQALKEKELRKAEPDMKVVAEYDAMIKDYEEKLKKVQ